MIAMENVGFLTGRTWRLVRLVLVEIARLVYIVSGNRRHNEKIEQGAQRTLSQVDSLYFKSQFPVIPGETRGGAIIYSTGSASAATGPCRVVLFLLNPTTGKQETVNFEFR
jgi:hypothetical protein